MSRAARAATKPTIPTSRHRRTCGVERPDGAIGSNPMKARKMSGGDTAASVSKSIMSPRRDHEVLPEFAREPSGRDSPNGLRLRMSRFLALVAGFGLATAGAAAPAAAQTPAPAAAATISIPFDPPLDTTLVYGWTQSSNEGPETVTLNIQVSFARDAEGYVMTVAGDLPPGTPPGQIATILQEPFSVRLTRYGELVGLADEAGYWARLDRVMAVILRGVPHAADRQAIETMVVRLRALPHDELLVSLCQRVGPIIAIAGHDIPAGEVAFDSVRESVIGPMTMQSRMTSEVRADGMAQVAIITTVPPDQLPGIAANLQRDFALPHADGAPLHQTGYEERNLYIVSRRTGLAETWTSTRTISWEVEGAPRSGVLTQELRLAH